MDLMPGKRGMTRQFFEKFSGLLIALQVLYSVPVSAADDAPMKSEYRFFPCNILVKVSLQGLPTIEGIRLHDSFESCGTGQALELSPAEDDADVSVPKNDSGFSMPTISVTVNENRFDIEVIRADTTPPIRYRAAKLAATTRSFALKSDTPGAPELRVSLEPVSGASHVGIIAPDVDATRVIDDLARFKNLKFRNVDLLTGTSVNFLFYDIPSRSLIDLIAQTSSTLFRTEGPSTYIFGKAANLARIEELRAELTALPLTESGARLTALMQKIVALSKPVEPGDFPVNVGFELQELSELALIDMDYARAESLIRQRIEQIEFFAYGEDSLPLGLALLDLGHVLRLESDSKAAGEVLRRSSRMLDKYADTETFPARARADSELAVLAFESGNLDESVNLARQAYAMLDSSELAGSDENQVYLARRVTSYVAGKIALKYRDNEDLKNAQIHLEHALKFTEGLFGLEDPLTDNWRFMVIVNLQEQNDRERAATFQAAQIKASLSRKNPLSMEYVFAMQSLVLYFAEQENFSSASMLWSRHVEVLKSSPALGSRVQASAMRGLALLQRLNGDVAEAIATEREAARLKISPDEKESDATPTSRIADSLLNRTLAGELSSHYSRLVVTLRRSGKIGDPSLILAQWREMESLIAQGDSSHAVMALVALRKTLELSRKTPSAIKKGIDPRINELCTLWKTKMPKLTIAQEACPSF